MNVLPVPISPDDGGALVGLEGERRAAYGVGLRAERVAQEPGELDGLLGWAVDGRVGLHYPLGDGVLERVDEVREVQRCVPHP